ncbi:YheT family hydrolase [Thalassoroseus pseudoceratinae]|uniref:YheT family hydrolase n=1 Tax=Thalassoroseus pseudoceratinae TaxID=2713176 RepID=UPI0014203BEA|nr:alpha/beta fold hydrolase [Thalassoroseus pseudoceratinae]
MSRFDAPMFQPHWLIRGGHAQTIAGTYLRSVDKLEETIVHRVSLPDGDVLLLHENRPSSWQPEDRVTLLLPGLTGCHQSGYLRRTACKLNTRGVRTFRFDPRGWGAGEGMSVGWAHGGRTDDLAACIDFIVNLAPQSMLSVAGFSLSGNILLKYLATFPNRPKQLERAIASCPAIDLAACADRLDQPLINRTYGRHFLRSLSAHVQKRGEWPTEFEKTAWQNWTLRDFDERLTAARAGFASSADYYRESSSKPHLPQIDVPTLIIAAEDDPVVPGDSFADLKISPCTNLHLTKYGGHLGYIGRRGIDPDQRWLDWRIVDWLLPDASK